MRKVFLLVCLLVVSSACIKVPEFTVVRAKRTKTTPSTGATLYFAEGGKPSQFAVFDNVVLRLPFADGDPSDPPEPEEPDPPKEIHLPPPPPPLPDKDPCQPPFCIRFKPGGNGEEYFWPVGPIKNPKAYNPGDPPPPLLLTRLPKDAKYPGLTTLSIFRFPLLSAKRMVITDKRFQRDFDKTSTASNPHAFGTAKPTFPPICVFAVCVELSQNKDYQFVHVKQH